MGRVIIDLTEKFMSGAKLQPDGMYEYENFHFDLHPYKHASLFNGSLWFNPIVAAAQYLWFVNADRDDTSIYKYIPSYRDTANKQSPLHNSNYGYYFYTENNVELCIDQLLLNANTRRASFMINNNSVAFGSDTDKLCTNSISFRIRNNRLNMSVHMRSNEFLNMMPYDIFQFCMLYGVVYSKLRKVYDTLEIGTYHHSADSMHTDKVSFIALKTFYFTSAERFNLVNFTNPDFKMKSYEFFKNLVTTFELKNK